MRPRVHKNRSTKYRIKSFGKNFKSEFGLSSTILFLFPLLRLLGQRLMITRLNNVDYRFKIFNQNLLKFDLEYKPEVL